MSNCSERDVTAVAAEVRQYVPKGFTRSDNRAIVPYGVLYRAAAAIERQAAQLARTRALVTAANEHCMKLLTERDDLRRQLEELKAGAPNDG